MCDLLGIKRDSNTTEAVIMTLILQEFIIYNKLKVSEIKEIIENHNIPLPPLQQGEKKLKSYYVRTLEEAIQPDGTFLVHGNRGFTQERRQDQRKQDLGVLCLQDMSVKARHWLVFLLFYTNMLQELKCMIPRHMVY